MRRQKYHLGTYLLEDCSAIENVPFRIEQTYVIRVITIYDLSNRIKFPSSNSLYLTFASKHLKGFTFCYVTVMSPMTVAVIPQLFTKAIVLRPQQLQRS